MKNFLVVLLSFMPGMALAQPNVFVPQYSPPIYISGGSLQLSIGSGLSLSGSSLVSSGGGTTFATTGALQLSGSILSLNTSPSYFSLSGGTLLTTATSSTTWASYLGLGTAAYTSSASYQPLGSYVTYNVSGTGNITTSGTVGFGLLSFDGGLSSSDGSGDLTVAGQIIALGSLQSGSINVTSTGSLTLLQVANNSILGTNSNTHRAIAVTLANGLAYSSGTLSIPSLNLSGSCGVNSLAVSSTVNVANLNAQYLSGVQSSGFVQSLTASTGIAITGTMPNLTITNTAAGGGTQATVTCTGVAASGTIICSMPHQGPSYKKVIINLNGSTGTTTVYSFPVAFTVTPSVFLGTGISGTITPTTTQVTVATTAMSGFVVIEGY